MSMYGPYQSRDDAINMIAHLRRLNKGAPNAKYTVKKGKNGWIIDVDSSRDTSR